MSLISGLCIAWMAAPLSHAQTQAQWSAIERSQQDRFNAEYQRSQELTGLVNVNQTLLGREKAIAEERLEIARAYNNLTKKDDKPFDITPYLTTLGILGAAFITSTKTARSLIDSIIRKGDLDRETEEEKAKWANDAEHRRLQISECDRRIEALGQLIISIRLFARDASEISGITLYVKREYASRNIEKETDKIKASFNSEMAPRFENVFALKAKLDTDAQTLLIEAEKYGFVPEEVTGKPLPLGALVSQWTVSTENYATENFVNYSTFVGQQKELVRELWALSEIEVNKKQALMTGQTQIPVDVKYRWITSENFENAYSEELLDSNKEVLKQAARAQAERDR